MLSFWTFFIEKRAFSFLLIATLIIAGTFCIVTIPKESTPEVKVPIGIVSTVLPGASAEDTEKLITNKIEDSVYNVDNLDTLTSVSGEGLSTVVVQFDASADIDKSISDLKDAVTRAKSDLPAEAKDPIVTKVSFNDQPMLIVSVSADAPPSELITIANNLKDQIKTVAGVSNVTISGVRDRETQVIVRKEALDSYGIRLIDVIAALQAANASLPIGTIEVDGVNYAVKFQGSIDDPSQVGDIAITTKNGIPIYVRDVAVVSDGLQNVTNFSRISVGGKPSAQAITLYVYKRTGGDITKIGGDVKAAINDFQKTQLTGSQVLVSFDAGDQVQKDLSNLSSTGLQTVVLVMLILFLTLGWREAIIAGMSIPISFLIAFIALNLTGNTLNIVSLFSLILAIGILVDSGIVVTEAIHTRYKKFGDAKKAAYESLHEYAWPLMAGTLTSIGVFVPLFFISGITGQFIASIPFTIIFVLLASIFAALGIIPLIAILFTKNTHTAFEARQERYNDIARAWYKTFLRSKLENRRFQKFFLWSIILAFVVAITFPIFGIVGVTFFPQDNGTSIYISLEEPQGTTLGVTDLGIREVEEVLYNTKRYPEIESFVTTVGESSVFGGGTTGGVSDDTKLANITINLVDKSKRSRTSTDVVEALRKDLAFIHTSTIHVDEPNNGPPTGAPVEVKVTGNNVGDLNQVATQVKHLLESLQGTVDVQTSETNDGNQFVLTIDRAKASELGLNPMIIAETLRGAVNGTTATTIRNPEKDIDVVVKLNLNGDFTSSEDTTKATVDNLLQIPIQTPNGSVLLGSVVSASLAQSSAVINHEDKKRIVSVTSQLKPGATAPEISSEFDAHKKDLTIPAGVTVTFGGQNTDVNKSFRDMFIALIGGMVLMLMILVLVFNSFRYTFYLLGIVPLSLIGVMVGLAVSFQPLSFPSMLGFIALAGVIINHAIILLDSMVHQLNSRTNDPLIDIIVDSAATRLRPIVLTTVTTVVGMIPLINGGGLWAPIAYTIMFGLTFSMVLSLLFIPILFYRSPKVRKIHSAGPLE